jgi:hypothetical protein
MSPKKEPHFFNFDHGYHGVANEREYYSLFSEARGETRIAEASVWYLASHEAVPEIERRSPHARYIVCLRNPIEMAVSLFHQQRFNGIEHEREFDQAWRLGPIRRMGKAVRCWRTEPRYTDYYSACLLGEQYSRLLGVVSEERVFPILLEDLVERQPEVLERLVTFLGISKESHPLARENTAKTRRNQCINKCVRLVGGLRRLCRVRGGMGLLSWIDRVNSCPLSVQKPIPRLRNHLVEAFRSDIDVLASRLNRRLDHWTAQGEDSRSAAA